MKSLVPQRVHLTVAVFFIALLLSMYLLIGITGNVYVPYGFILVVSIFMLLLVLALNISAFLTEKSKRLPVFIALLILVEIMCLPLVRRWCMATSHRRFFSKDIYSYNLIVDQIINKEQGLTSDLRPLSEITGYSGVITARTNSDRSIYIVFQGRNGSPRRGYLYYSGRDLVPQPGSLGEYIFRDEPAGQTFFHLTNDWYEF
jgi:hypothetical protein